PTSRPGDSSPLPSPAPFGPHPRSSRDSIHIGHAVGGGFVQSIFSPPSRRPPFECFPNVSRRDADLKILCKMSSTVKCGVNHSEIRSQSTFIRLTPHFTVLDIWSGSTTEIAFCR